MNTKTRQFDFTALSKSTSARSRHYHKLHDCEECGTAFNITQFKRWYCCDQCSFIATQRILDQ